MPEDANEDFWRRCNGCKGPIDYSVTYYTCSVSTCNRKRTALFFCSVSCWEIHLPVARHREAWAEDQVAPSRATAARAAASEGSARPASGARTPKRTILKPSTPGINFPGGGSRDATKEVLVVASRLKEYIRETTGFSTSDRVLEPLSAILREVADHAVRNAAREERRTVLDRDIPRRIKIED